MSPLIKSKEYINVDIFKTPKSIDETMIGQILLFNDRDEWISHRLIKCNNELLLKGDFSNNVHKVNHLKAWGEIKTIETSNKRIKASRFSALISKLAEKQIKSNIKIIRKIYKGCIYSINRINRIFNFGSIEPSL